jgi:hypothetical protein
VAGPDEKLKAAMEKWVAVRVTDMRGVDLNVYRFNYDLTMAVLLMHPDGTIYSTYAGRDFTHADSHQSPTSLARVLDAALALHGKHVSRAKKPAVSATVEQLPWWRGNEKAQQAKCFHCHQVHDAWQQEGRKRGTWTERDQYTWPDPVQIGLRLDREEQMVVTDAAGAASSVRKGDRILSIAGRRTLAFGDVQRSLHEEPWEAHSLAVELLRDGKRVSVGIDLADGWKRPSPRVYAWRSMKWPMAPMPGFGGPLLTAEEKAALSLPAGSWAFRVRYIVTWGPNAKTGQRAREAGIRKGMVVHEVDGRSDFEGMDHFQAWFRMTRRPGTPVRIKAFQNGTPRTLTLTPLP